MRKRQPTVSIRISLKARNKLKIKAAQLGVTIIELIDALIK